MRTSALGARFSPRSINMALRFAQLGVALTIGPSETGTLGSALPHGIGKAREIVLVIASRANKSGVSNCGKICFALGEATISFTKSGCVTFQLSA